MNWLDKLEKKFGHLAINNLMFYIVLLTGSVYLLNIFDQTGMFIYRLLLIPERVMQGEIWRLFTYVFIPPTSSPIFIIFVLYFYYMIGIGLERVWGSFKFNLYYLIGVIATAIVSFLTGGLATSTYLNLTLFFAFARMYPNYELLLFFVLPLKIKYIAWFNWGLFIYTLLTAPVAEKITAIIALSNFFIFFGKDLVNDLKRRNKVRSNRKRFDKINYNDNKPLHRCTVCGITEKDDPKMDFRYCSKCEGSYEYCRDHLHCHQHIGSE